MGFSFLESHILFFLFFVALFLASPAAAFVTGALLVLDGGGFLSGKLDARL
jgi:hypothetical protein